MTDIATIMRTAPVIPVIVIDDLPTRCRSPKHLSQAACACSK